VGLPTAKEWLILSCYKCPCAALEDYVSLGEARAAPHDHQNIHEKALFDGASQALVSLMPPYPRILADAQKRVRRHPVGSQEWQDTLTREVVERVVGWASPREEDDLEAMLMEDFDAVRLCFPTSSFVMCRHIGSGQGTSAPSPPALLSLVPLHAWGGVAVVV